jgi:hypothetical protein
MAGDEDLGRMNRIVEAVMIYYNYFIPVHSDGRTAAEFSGTSPPAWLSALVMANREKEMPFREAKVIEQDSSHFHGLLVSSIAQDILEEGGKSKRGKVVVRIMEELEKDGGRGRDELKALERWAHRASKSRSGAEIEAADRLDEALGIGDGEEERATPQVVIPFVTIYRVEKKDRVRALLQTYKGNIAVHFLGKENSVELERDSEDQRTFEAYCHPAGRDENQVGTKLGVIKLDRDRLELSSTVEERHRALRDFVAKLVGQKSMHLVREMTDAIIDPDTGEPTTEDAIMQDEALAMVKERSLDQRLGEGLQECITAGMIIPAEKGEEDLLLVAPGFVAEVLDHYRKGIESGISPKADALREAILLQTLGHLQTLVEPRSNRVYRATVAVMVIVGVITKGAAKDGAKRVEGTLRRIIDLEPVKDDALPPLIDYLEVLAGANRNR